jgi:hypothetical protein
MLFWVALLVVIVAFVAAFSWGARGMSDREHKPGTQRLR